MQPEDRLNRPESNRPDYSRRPVMIDGGYSRPSARISEVRRPAPAAPLQPPVTPPTQISQTTPTVPPPTPSAPPQPALNEPSNHVDIPAPPHGFKPPARKPKRRVLKILGIAVLLIILIGSLVAIFMWQSNLNNPDKVFDRFLKKNFETTELKKYTTDGKDTQDLGLDLNALKNPIVYDKEKITVNGSQYKIVGYGSASRGIVSYVELPAAAKSPQSKALLNAQTVVRDNRNLPATAPEFLVQASDPRYAIISPVIFGNFSQNVSKDLLKSIKSANIYKYNPKEVKSQKINGKKILVYSIKPNFSELVILNQYAASTMGFPPLELTGAVNQLNQYKNATFRFYIAPGTDRLVKLEIIDGNRIVTTTYSDYNKAQTPIEPQTKVMWQNYFTPNNQMLVESAASQPAKVLDEARKAHLATIKSYLKTYYGQIGSYPALAQMNNPVWISTNLFGFDPELLRDPLSPSIMLSDSPKANVLAYSTVAETANKTCDNTPANGCAHYKLTVTLSNGQQYSVTDP